MTEIEYNEFAKKVLNKVSNLETHIINLIIPLQAINQLTERIEKPLLIDDLALSNLFKQFRESVLSLIEIIKTGDLKKILDSVKGLDQLATLNQNLGEIKYIGKRLHGIEQTLEEIKKDGIKRNVNLEFTCDGYELVKRPRGYNKADPIEDPDQALKELLNTISTREAKMLSHRLGLLGEKAKTYAALASVFKITGDRCSQIYKKALRKLRHPSRRALLDKVTNKDLRKEVFDG